MDKKDIWTRLAEPIESNNITVSDVRKRLDEVVPGEWDLTLELLPMIDTDIDMPCFKARLQILGVIRESTSSLISASSAQHKHAAGSAFINAAFMFGIGDDRPQPVP